MIQQQRPRSALRRPQTARRVQLDVHPTQASIIVRYDGERGQTQKTLQLQDFDDSVDLTALTAVLMERCVQIPTRQASELEHLLEFLRDRHRRADFVSPLASSLATPPRPLNFDVSLADLERYLEQLYEDGDEQKKGVAAIHALATSSLSNLQELAQNDVVVGALERVLRENWKRHLEMATWIVDFFCRLGAFADYHSILAEHKMGALVLSIVEYEWKRREAWRSEASSASDDASRRRWELAFARQDELLTGCARLLLTLTDDVRVQARMVRRNAIPLFVSLLSPDRSHALILAAAAVLLRLTVFSETVLMLRKAGIVERVERCWSIAAGSPSSSSFGLTENLLRLLFNVSFSAESRRELVDRGLVSGVAQLVVNGSRSDNRSTALNLLYQMSVDDGAKSMFAYTSVVPVLVHSTLADSTDASRRLVSAATLANAVLFRRNAQQLAAVAATGQDAAGLLDRVIERLVRMDNDKDSTTPVRLVLAKIVRNVAGHNDESAQKTIAKWTPQLLSIAMRTLSNSPNAAALQSAVGLECLGTAALSTGFDWNTLDDATWRWVDEKVCAPATPSSVRLQLVVLCGTAAARSEPVATRLATLVTRLQRVMSAEQEDDEFVVQLLHFLFSLLLHATLGRRLLEDSQRAPLGLYILELMHDKNAVVRAMCERAEKIIAELSEPWVRRIEAERFRHHNAEWLANVQRAGADGQETDDEEENEEDESDLSTDDHDLNGIVFGGQHVVFDDYHFEENGELQETNGDS